MTREIGALVETIQRRVHEWYEGPKPKLVVLCEEPFGAWELPTEYHLPFQNYEGQVPESAGAGSYYSS